MLRRSPFVAVAILATALPACGASGSPASNEAGQHVGRYEPTGDDGHDGSLEGAVRVVSGCFLVEAGDRWYVPSFPAAEVRWRDGRLRYAGDSFGAGDRILLRGGAATTAPGSWPQACASLEGLQRWTVSPGS